MGTGIGKRIMVSSTQVPSFSSQPFLALQTWESINYHPNVLLCDTFLPSMMLDHFLSTFFSSFPNTVLSLLFEEKK